jgi:hypothetical protein
VAIYAEETVDAESQATCCALGIYPHSDHNALVEHRSAVREYVIRSETLAVFAEQLRAVKRA